MVLFCEVKRKRSWFFCLVLFSQLAYVVLSLLVPINGRVGWELRFFLAGGFTQIGHSLWAYCCGLYRSFGLMKRKKETGLLLAMGFEPMRTYVQKILSLPP